MSTDLTVDVYHQEKLYQLPCLVVRGPGPSLLGRDWLEHLKLDWSTVHRMDSEGYVKIFPELFSEGLGTLKGVDATLHVDDKVISRPVPLALRVKVETELNMLQAEEVTKPI